MSSIKNYFSLIKFSHTIFAMPFALIGFFLGYQQTISGQFSNNYFNIAAAFNKPAIIFLLVVLCMVFARSAAMAFNRWLDAGYDAKNPRTAIREIPSGIIKPQNALLFTIVNCLLFITCCFFINTICFYLSPVALFVVLFYSYTKRFTALCHLVLGVGLSLAPIGAYLAITGHFALLPVLFSFTVLCWVSGFDIIYALQDVEFDEQQQLHSLPVLLGKKNALHISELLHFLSFTLVVLAGYFGNFNSWYWIGTVFFGGLLIYQHTLVKPTDLSKVNLAFFTTNGVAAVVFAAFVLMDILLG